MTSLSPLMQEVLQSGGTIELTVSGNSMWPMLRHRISRVRLAPVEKLRKGDLPLYRRADGKFILHRVVAVKDGTYTCCGDNQWRVEPNLTEDQMIAVVTHFARKERWVGADNGLDRLYWKFWVAVRPLRRLIFGGFNRIKQTLRRLLK